MGVDAEKYRYLKTNRSHRELPDIVCFFISPCALRALRETGFLILSSGLKLS